jgi:hypothetical protein
VGSEDVRKAVDAGDVDGLRNLLRDDPSLLTSLVVGMVRFYGTPHTTGRAISLGCFSRLGGRG